MTDTGDTLAPGTRLDELEIERVLGAGGFGVTYLARDVSLDAWRAVKEYLPRDWGTRLRDGTIGPRTGADAEDYQWGLTRFLDEARILAQFDHPNLVRVYRVFEAQGTAYMVTEYVEGRTLSAALQSVGAVVGAAGSGVAGGADGRSVGGARGGSAAPGHQAWERDGAWGRDAGADRLRVGAAGDGSAVAVGDGGVDAGVCAA